MSVQGLLERARANGLTVFLRDGKLKVRALQKPQGEVRVLIQELRQHKAAILEALNQDDDPILTPDQWYREFHRLHVQVVQETPDLDWAWLRECRPELLQSIRDKEAELDALGDARLSEVMAIMGQWRELILKAEFEKLEASNAQPDQGDLDLKANRSES